jgi:hypothetical protein
VIKILYDYSTGGEGKDFNGGERRRGKRKGGILINNVGIYLVS